MQDFQAIYSIDSLQRVNPVITGLFKLRWKLGELFGWDVTGQEAPESSYVHRVTEEDRARSLVEPGSIDSPFRVIYAFENEALYELINVTSHTLLLMAMEQATDGYIVYWAVHVNRVSWITPLYMTLIDPFRWILVYPAVIKNVERAWATAYGGMESLRR